MKYRCIIRAKLNSIPILVRLLLIFLTTALSALLLLTAIFHLLSDNKQHRNDIDFLADYGLMLANRIGSPPDIATSQQVAENLGLIITISQPGSSWSSHPEWNNSQMPAFEQEDFIQSRFDNVTVSHCMEKIHVKIQQGTTQILITHDILFQHKNLRLALAISLLLMLVLLYISYRCVKKLFLPIKALEHGSLQFTQGNFDHKIPVEREDDLGRLTHVMNNMAQQIEKMLQAKRQMLLAISHELRTPLTRMKLATELLDDVPLQSSLRHDIDEMEQLVTELLESERLQSKHQVLSLQQMTIEPLITSVVDELTVNNDARIERIISNPLTPLLIDPIRIKLLLRNLLLNALQYSTQPVLLRLDETESTLIITVQDKGCGIAPEHLEHLTDPFYRVDDARLRKTGGYGLGLYLCKLIVDAHGGHIDIQSELNKGTRVNIMLPKPSHH